LEWLGVLESGKSVKGSESGGCWKAHMSFANVELLRKRSIVHRFGYYEGDSNENIKSAIKIKKTARLSCKLILVV
jgi:hypothetical protein